MIIRTGFTPDSAVTIGGNIATDIAFVSSAELHAKTPAGNKGARDVVVVNPDGQTGRGDIHRVFLSRINTLSRLEKNHRQQTTEENEK